MRADLCGWQRVWGALIRAIEAYLSKPAWLRRLGRGARARGLRRRGPEWPQLRARVVANRAGQSTKGNA